MIFTDDARALMHRLCPVPNTEMWYAIISPAMRRCRHFGTTTITAEDITTALFSPCYTTGAIAVVTISR